MAKQAVDSLEKGLVELLTNADESYNRLTQKGHAVSGKIEIVIDRHGKTKPTTLQVIDYAEGMDDQEMEKCITESSIQLYFGTEGEGQDEAANQCLVAELVTQIACEEIARVSREKGQLNIPPGIKELDAFYNYLNKLRIQNAGLIHKLLVNAKYRRQ